MVAEDGMSIGTEPSLERLRATISSCERCGLHETRTLPVFGEGNESASVMIVGEAPGRNEDESGRPFIGKAGERLDEMLSLAGLSREDVFVANVLKCRPPKNRDPRPDEIACCSPYLVEQIRAVSPRVIVTFGNFATQFVLGTKKGVSEIHGQLFPDVVVSCGDEHTMPVSVYPVFHPAATIYRPQWKEILGGDMRALAKILESMPE